MNTKKNKNTKSKGNVSKIVASTRGRKQIELPINLESTKPFSVGSILALVSRRKFGHATRVTIGKRINDLLARKKIKQVDKKLSVSGRGQPVRWYLPTKRGSKKVASVKANETPVMPVENAAALAA